ncbi:MAG: hypothetical protein CTY15_08955 [Methylocystis sp.]|nr:MAG: hypothetical protein CTY15_08955 [Methylocystis sp.]
MALGETQALLARLFTDVAARRAFFAAPQAEALRYGLSDEEAATLAGLDRGEVESFAKSLLGKRALDTRKTLPLTARALGDRFDRLLFEAIDAPTKERHRGDAAALAQRLATTPCSPPWIADLARYEMAFVDARRSGFVALARRFAWPVNDIARQLAAGARPDVSPRGRVGLWFRAPQGRMFHHMF